MARPRIQILVDRPRRAQARTARAIARCLVDEFDIRVRYESTAPDLADHSSDLLVVSSWESTWYRQFDMPNDRLVKSVEDERWLAQGDRSGGLTPAAFAATWLADARIVTCVSERLERLLAPHHGGVVHTKLGFDPFVFPARRTWGGPLRLGWVGDAQDASKGVADVLQPAARAAGVELSVGGGDPQLAAMGEFYRGLDVFALASRHEGAPLTLIEALASGCFPVCVDVGVVRELVVHGESGLIVERDVGAFCEAFAWCRDNADAVREIGLRNAERMRHRRTWDHVAGRWRELLHTALAPESVRPIESVAVAVPLHPLGAR